MKYFFVHYALIDGNNVSNEKNSVIGMLSKHFDPGYFYKALLLLPRQTEYKFIIRNFQEISKKEFMFFKKFYKEREKR